MCARIFPVSFDAFRERCCGLGPPEPLLSRTPISDEAFRTQCSSIDVINKLESGTHSIQASQGLGNGFGCG